MTFFVYFDLIIKNNIASFLVVLIIGKVVYLSSVIKLTGDCKASGTYDYTFIISQAENRIKTIITYWLLTNQRL